MMYTHLNLVESCCFTASYCFFPYFHCSFDPFTCILLHSFPIFLLIFCEISLSSMGIPSCVTQVFPYWRLSDLKRAAGRVLCVKVGELTTEKGTLLCGDGTSLGEAGYGWVQRCFFFFRACQGHALFFIEMVIVSYYHYDYFSLLGFCFIASSTVRLY